MKNVSIVILLVLLLFGVMSCSIIDKLSGGPDLAKAGDLWSDVPRMDGVTKSDLELPFAVKFLIRTALNNMWRLNKDGEDKTPASGDWIVFTTTGTPDDIQKFYTNERMTSFGSWDANKDSTCLDNKDKNAKGTLCVFHKVTDTKETQLAIFAAVDDAKKQTNIFYIRLEKDIDPAKKTAAPANKK